MTMTTTNRPKTRRWFSPSALADFANNSFLTVARGTGTVVRGVQSGSAKSISVLAKPIQKKAGTPENTPAVSTPPAAKPQASVPAAAKPAPAPVAARPPVQPIPAVSARVATKDAQVATARAPVLPTPAELAPTMIAPPPRAPEPAAPVAVEPPPAPPPIAAPVVFAPPPVVFTPAPVTTVSVAARVEPAPPAAAMAGTAPTEPPKPRAEGQESKGVTGFLKSIFRSDSPEVREAAKVSPQTPVTSTAEPSRRQSAGPLAIPKQPIDVEALVAQHAFSSRAEMLGALVSVNEFLSGNPRESIDAQRQILATGAAFAEPVLLAAFQKQSPRLTELALDGLYRLDPEKLEPVIKDLLASDRRELRLAALRAAQWLGDDQARPLFELAATDPSPDVRRRLVCYLSWRGTPWAMFEVRGLCNDESLAVKWAAIGVLARSQPDVAAELMGRTPPSDEDASYRRRIEAALAKKPSDAAKSAASRPVIRPAVGKSQSKSRPAL